MWAHNLTCQQLEVICIERQSSILNGSTRKKKKQWKILPIFFLLRWKISLFFGSNTMYRFDRCCRFLIDLISCLITFPEEKMKSTISKWRHSMRRECENERESNANVCDESSIQSIFCRLRFILIKSCSQIAFFHALFRFDLQYNISAPVTDGQMKCEQNE